MNLIAVRKGRSKPAACCVCGQWRPVFARETRRYLDTGAKGSLCFCADCRHMAGKDSVVIRACAACHVRRDIRRYSSCSCGFSGLCHPSRCMNEYFAPAEGVQVTFDAEGKFREAD